MKRKYLVLFLFVFLFTFVPIAKAKQYTFSNKEDYSKNYDFYCEYSTKTSDGGNNAYKFVLYAKDDSFSMTIDGKNITQMMNYQFGDFNRNIQVYATKMDLNNSCPDLKLSLDSEIQYGIHLSTDSTADRTVYEMPGGTAILSKEYEDSGQTAETNGAVCEKSYVINEGPHKNTELTVQFYKTSNGKNCYSLKNNNTENNVESCDGKPLSINNFNGKGNLQISFYNERHYNIIYRNATFDSFPCSEINFSVENGVLTQVYIKGNEDKAFLDSFKDVRDFILGTYEYKEGCSVLGNETMEVLQTILNYLRIAAVALLLVLGSLDFAGAVMSDKDDAMKSAGKKFKNRLIACVVVFLIPALVNIALFVVNKSDSVCDFFGGEITTVDSE